LRTKLRAEGSGGLEGCHVVLASDTYLGLDQIVSL